MALLDMNENQAELLYLARRVARALEAIASELQAVRESPGEGGCCNPSSWAWCRTCNTTLTDEGDCEANECPICGSVLKPDKESK